MNYEIKILLSIIVWLFLFILYKITKKPAMKAKSLAVFISVGIALGIAFINDFENISKISMIIVGIIYFVLKHFFEKLFEEE